MPLNNDFKKLFLDIYHSIKMHRYTVISILINIMYLYDSNNFLIKQMKILQVATLNFRTCVSQPVQDN